MSLLRRSTRRSRKTCGESWPKGYSTFRCLSGAGPRPAVLLFGRSGTCPTLLFVQFADAFDRIDLLHRFIGAQAHDAGEAQRITAVMPRGLLDIIERHFDDDVRLDRPAEALV